jgi:hypothetical protein
MLYSGIDYLSIAENKHPDSVGVLNHNGSSIGKMMEVLNI